MKCGDRHEGGRPHRDERKNRATSGLWTRLRFEGFEADGSHALRACFNIVPTDDRPFRATVELSPRTGQVYGVHASDGPAFDGGTTGDRDVDLRLGEAARDELARARAAAFVLRFDQRRGQ
jgi:hypothetical protein